MMAVSIVPIMPLVFPGMPALLTQPWLRAPAMLALQVLAIG